MTINPATFTFFLGAFILLGVILISFVISYFSAVRRLRKLEENEDNLYKKTIQEEKEIAMRAQTDYQKTIEDANLKAKSIISQATSINQSAGNAMNQALTQLSSMEKQVMESKTQEVLNAYQNELSTINSNNLQMLKSVSDKMLTEANSQLESLKKSLSQETFEKHKVAEQKIQEEYEKLSQELKMYKDEQYKKIDNNIYEVLLNISKLALGRGLSLEEHQDLIIDALERAKREGELG